MFSTTYIFVFLGIAFLISLGQNIIRYGHHSTYRPWRSIIYLSISLLLFVVILPLVLRFSRKIYQNYRNYYTASALGLIFLSITIFFLLSSSLMYITGFYDGFLTEKYARSYFGRDAFWHLIALTALLAYVPFRKQEAKVKMITGSHGRKKVSVPAHTIQWIETDDHYLKIHTAQFTLLKRDTLENMAKELAPQFIRIHRKYLVNKDEIANQEKENRATFIVLNNGERLKVSRSYEAQLQL